MTNRAGRLMAVLAVPAGVALGLFVSGPGRPNESLAQEAPAAKAQGDQADRPMRIANRQFASVREFVQAGRRCDTPIPTENQIRRSRLAADAVRRLAGVEDALSPTNEVTVKVAFHVIHKGDEGKVKVGQINKQIEVLNKAYESSGFKFVLDGTPDFTDVAGDSREPWFTMGHFSAAEREAKQALGRDTERFLNIYTANLGDSLLGWATFPSDLAGDTVRDGVVVLYTSLPAEDGSANPDGGPFGLGQTATHEVGHWLGLYHTFQGECFPPGDEVEDTPPHQVNFGCPPESTDTCAGDKDPNDASKPWTDPVHNYMNYTDDACMTELTTRQIRRSREQTTTFRPRLYDVSPTVRSSIANAARSAVQ